MAHIVTCVYCGGRFDRDKVSFVQISNRRYAHEACSKQRTTSISQEELDYNNLLNYIKQLFNITNIPATIKKEIMDFRKEYGYTYTGIQKTLYWFYELKGNSIEKANGHLGIVPYVYDDASNYFYKVFVAKAAASSMQINVLPKKQYIIHSPLVTTAMKQKRFFDFEWEDNNG